MPRYRMLVDCDYGSTGDAVEAQQVIELGMDACQVNEMTESFSSNQLGYKRFIELNDDWDATWFYDWTREVVGRFRGVSGTHITHTCTHDDAAVKDCDTQNYVVQTITG